MIIAALCVLSVSIGMVLGALVMGACAASGNIDREMGLK